MLGKLFRAIASDYKNYRMGPGWKERGVINALTAAEKLKSAAQEREMRSQEMDIRREDAHLRQTAAKRVARESVIKDAKDTADIYPSLPEPHLPNNLPGPVQGPMFKVPEGPDGQPGFTLDPAEIRAFKLAEQQREAREKMVDMTSAPRLKSRLGIESDYVDPQILSASTALSGQDAAERRAAASAGGRGGSGYGDNIGWTPLYDANRALIAKTKTVADPNAPNGYRTIVAPIDMPGDEPVYGAPPPGIPQGGRDSIAATSHVLGLIGRVRESVTAAQAALGPLAGRLLNVQIGQLGGYGTTQAERIMAQRMLTLLSTRSFAEGGKNLTGTEKEILFRQLPQPTDTVQQAFDKLAIAEEELKDAQQKRLAVIPQYQRPQVDRQFSDQVADPKAGPPIGTRKTFPNGRVGVWDGRGYKAVQ